MSDIFKLRVDVGTSHIELMSTEQSEKPCGARHSGPFVV